MKNLTRALLDGALVVLPIGAIVLIVLAIVEKVQHGAEPLAGRFVHPAIVAVVALLLLCIVVGLMIRSAVGRRTRDILEARLFEQIPGYRLVKAFVGNGPLVEDGGRAMRPALAAVEEGHCPALVMDELHDGRLVVFMPDSPTSMSGSIHILSPDKIVLLDVPLMPFMKAISSWGLGFRELIGTR